MKMDINMSHRLVALLLVMICLSCNMRRVWATMQQLELRQHQKRLNKHTIKSIKSPDGDIIDCVHISQQPAFDHPLLRNHTIQMRPSFLPLGLYDENRVASKKETSPIRQLWHQNGRCPEDTIPVRRTNNDDVSIERYGKKMHGTIPNPTSIGLDQFNVTGREVAAVVVSGNHTFFGARAIMNVWNPKVILPDQYSAAQISLLGEGIPNAIQAGWHVHPSLYGDSKTRLFGYWALNWETGINGCWNVVCPGFVQVNKDIALGAVVDPISNYNGNQYEITVMVFKDPETKNWWLVFGNQTALGYWPASILPNLNNGASRVQWGGEVANPKQNGEHTTTEMGSGHFPEEGFGKASYFKNIQIILLDNILLDPADIGPVVTQSNCYNVHNDRSTDWGNYFYYGGPGKNPNCP